MVLEYAKNDFMIRSKQLTNYDITIKTICMGDDKYAINTLV